MRYLHSLFLLLFIPFFFSSVYADTLTVGTIERPPFAYQENGQWTGFSIDVWKEISRINGYETEYKAYDVFGDMISDTRDGLNDLSVANISITLEREKEMDFSYPIYDSGLTMMIQRQESTQNIYLQVLTDVKFWIYVLGTLALLVLALCRRKLLPKLLGKKKHHSIYLRLTLILFWILSSIACFNFTVVKYELQQNNNSSILTYADIAERKVGVTMGSTSERYVSKTSNQHQSYNTLQELYKALRDKEVDVVVHDLPILQYYVKTGGASDMEIVGDVFQDEKYGVVMPNDSPRKEDINRAILQMFSEGTYEDIYQKYF